MILEVEQKFAIIGRDYLLLHDPISCCINPFTIKSLSLLAQHTHHSQLIPQYSNHNLLVDLDLKR